MFLPQGFVFVHFVEDGLSPVLFYMSLKNKPPGTAFRIQPETTPDCFSCFRSIKIKRFDNCFVLNFHTADRNCSHDTKLLIVGQQNTKK
jgi:hypothetical protein